MKMLKEKHGGAGRSTRRKMGRSVL